MCDAWTLDPDAAGACSCSNGIGFFYDGDEAAVCGFIRCEEVGEVEVCEAVDVGNFYF